ncbi:MAG: hypothetical protein ACF8OB_03095, partial [Phycisphaeraceae bacterium JB051]
AVSGGDVPTVDGHDNVSTLSLRQFYDEVARQGGYLFRKHDPRPGWQCLWQGIQQIRHYIDAIEKLGMQLTKSCV